jgi:hypothetical protein
MACSRRNWRRISRVKSMKTTGIRVGNWLSQKQAQTLLSTPDISNLRGLRDRAILAVLLGCGLRRSEVAALTFAHVQQRDDRWCIADLVGKHGRVRTPRPAWVKVAIDAWATPAEISTDRIFRPVNRAGAVSGERLGEKVVWQVLRRHAAEMGIPGVAPYDLRRTCAKRCRAAVAILSRSRCSSATHPCRPPSDILEPGRTSLTLRTTGSSCGWIANSYGVRSSFAGSMACDCQQVFQMLLAQVSEGSKTGLPERPVSPISLLAKPIQLLGRRRQPSRLSCESGSRPRRFRPSGERVDRRGPGFRRRADNARVCVGSGLAIPGESRVFEDPPAVVALSGSNARMAANAAGCPIFP